MAGKVKSQFLVVSWQLLLLLWKNFILQIRRPVGTVFELLIPPLAVVVLIGLRFGVFKQDERCFVTFNSDPLTVPLPNNTYQIYYTPITPETERIAACIAQKLPYADIIGAETEDQIEANLSRPESIPPPFLFLQPVEISGKNFTIERPVGCFIRGAGIVFDDLDDSDGRIEYTLRLRHEVGEWETWVTQTAGPFFEQLGPRVDNNFYLQEGFVHLENIVGEAIIRLMKNPNMTDCNGTLEEDITVSMKQLPYPEYTVDPFLAVTTTFLPFLLVLAYIYSAGVFTKELVLEKESRIRESMLMMGLPLWVLWVTWFIKQFVFLSITSFFMALLLKTGQIFPESDFFLLLIFLSFFNVSAISFSFLLSVWFNTARVGLLAGLLGWFLNYIPYIFIPPYYTTFNLGSKIAFCILSNTCVGLGINTIALLEIRGEGIQWNNVDEPISLDDDFNFAWMLMMLIVDSIVYMLIAWYVNGVKPGQYGVPKPFYFPFLPSYWTGKPFKSKKKDADGMLEVKNENFNAKAHEEEPKNLSVGISIRNLTKIYDENILTKLLSSYKDQRRRKVAVDELSLNMYEGQITALLGHNGAGKTTTISILTGLYTPTSGTAVINDYDIRTNMDQIRQSLGICPQHNVLFDRLTVLEHLKFFARLKGVRGKAVQEEADKMIEDLQLQDKGDAPSSNLSGGMKRKLSVGIAFIGGSKIVVLDEPTSGIDPYARRAIWDMLIKYKEGRTMLLTTHFMDEADLLGDRIAIMAEGKVHCSGSSLFLKSRYGVGYHMVVVKVASCVSSRVAQIVTSMVPDSKNVTDVGTELSFILPSTSSHHFPELFERLESNKEELGIAGFGISVTTMEEVFMKVGEGNDETLEHRLERNGTVTDTPISHMTSPHQAGVTEVEDIKSEPVAVKVELSGGEEGGKQGERRISQGEGGTLFRDNVDTAFLMPALPKDSVRNSGLVLWVQQFCALFLKRVYNTIRFWQAVISQLILPLIFVLLALILAVILPNANENDPVRQLRIDNSGRDPNRRIVFYAEFGDAPRGVFNFGGQLNIGETEVKDYTQKSLDIISSKVQNGTNISQCCEYNYQILDKFCAVQRGEDFDCGSQFGYNQCTRCLRCCNATSTTAPTCTNPITQIRESRRRNFCPAPPKVSDVDIEEGATGRLDSDLPYVDEVLLEEAQDLEPDVYIRRVQAGFVMSYREPAYAACGCSSVNADVFEETVKQFSVCRTIDGAAIYSLQHSGLPWLNETTCPLFGSGSGSGSDKSSGSSSSQLLLDDNYLVDGTSANFQQIFLCSEEIEKSSLCHIEKQPLAAVAPAQTRRQITATVYYNNNPWHMSAAALNAFHNIWLRQATGRSELQLFVNNHPLPRTIEAEIRATQYNYNGFSIGSTVVFGFSFLIASFVLFLVNEKESKAKHLQFVSGVSVTSYWLSTFIWDMINAMIPIFLTFILFAAFQVDGYKDEALGAILFILILTCWSTIPIVYCVSFLFSNSLVAFALIVIFLFLSSQACLIIVLVVTDQDVVDGLHYFFLLDPAYNLAIALNDLYINNIVLELCTASTLARFICEMDDSIRYVDDIFSTDRPGIGINLIYMLLEGILFFTLTLLIEYKFFVPEIRALLQENGNGNGNSNGGTSEPIQVVEQTRHTAVIEEDDDVAAERNKVMTGAVNENDIIVIKNLVKIYGRRLDGFSLRPAKLAVQGITLTIPRGECFGLLGVNGAGKTTTFSILTGDINPTDGTAFIAGFDIRNNLRKVQQRVGYCPQFDALIERMTGRELLTMFARLRGIPEQLIKQAVEAEVVRLDLAKHAGKQCGKYSGGNKRKLSTAIALVGNPSIILLDEPTTGMDPSTRRYLWDVLTGVTQEGRSIVLTSHSMEECEALCTRLAIMVNGQFKCLGSIQHLKNKFGAGFNLHTKVKLSPPETNPDLTSLSSPRTRFSFRRRGSLHIQRSFRMQRSFRRQVSVNRHRSFHIQRSFHHQGSSGRQDSSGRHGSCDTHPATITSSERSTSSQMSIPLGGGVTFDPFDTTALHIFIKENFAGALLLEEHQGSVTYQLPSADLTWASVFRKLESNKERLGITDYSVSQTTLEQVFISFAKKQTE